MNERYQPAPGVVWRALDDGLILLDTRRGHYFELNASGRHLFELISAGHALSAAIERMQGSYEVDPLRLQADMRQLCAELLAQGLILILKSGAEPPDSHRSPVQNHSGR
jgi:hypothetical protein